METSPTVSLVLAPSRQPLPKDDNDKPPHATHKNASGENYTTGDQDPTDPREHTRTPPERRFAMGRIRRNIPPNDHQTISTHPGRAMGDKLLTISRNGSQKEVQRHSFQGKHPGNFPSLSFPAALASLLQANTSCIQYERYRILTGLHRAKTSRIQYGRYRILTGFTIYRRIIMST